ncbi:Cystathionine beta-lyase [Lentibacillus sp. JNUCC-1]|uniref:MalY/PatB family protein n=1 Tax=Lentibacillus sp. JNUCC-1 TaxID=2654513 RepID=UPI0012E74DD4|nr:MalY/PatB family protein [Lentibacillus sp. JNUCC-1]MUV39235.1 Cystathionine beta-lyase [Lentibacillus sp. JNUCC-1]
MRQFEQLLDRKNTRSVKWDALQLLFETDDVLPMWVADMDFKAPEAVTQALQKRVDHGVYGYTSIDNDIHSAIIDWISKRHNWDIQGEWLTFSPGVVTSLHIAVQTFTEPGDSILIQSPVYTPFYSVIEQHDRTLIKNPLTETNGYYTIDFEDFENKLKQGVKAFILCSPHNPVGRVWTKDELQRMAELCLEYDVLMISDEIHCDLVYPGFKHIPLASLSNDIKKQTITCMSPSKTFNLAGLQASYIITEDDDKRKQLDEAFEKQGLKMLNTMGNFALEAAYRCGEKWLDELMTTLESHKTYVIKRLTEDTNGKLNVLEPEGTYLLWIDFSKLGMTNEEIKDFLVKEAKVGLNNGAAYGEEGSQYMRMNIACPHETLEEGVTRVVEAVNRRF